MAALLGAWLSGGQALAVVIMGTIGGIAGIMALFAAYKMGFFALGVLGGVAVAHHVLVGQTQEWVLPAIAGAGLLGGLVALFAEKPMMIWATASVGAWIIVQVGLLYAASAGGAEVLRMANTYPWAVPACWGTLAVSGMLLQTFAGRAPDKKRSS